MKALVTALAFAALAPALSADILVAYTMTGGADAIFAATTTHPAVGVTPIVPKHLTKGSLDIGGANGRIIVFQPAQASTSVAATLAQGTYFSITLTPPPGGALRLGSLEFDAAAGGASITRTFRVFSSVTGFAPGGELATDTNGEGGALPTQPIVKSYQVDLRHPGFQTITSPVEFRFYVETEQTFQTLVFDNLSVSGAVVGR